jgi:hypothetical protein
MSNLLLRHLGSPDAVAAHRRREADRARQERDALARRVAADDALERLGLPEGGAEALLFALERDRLLGREAALRRRVKRLEAQNAELRTQLEALARKVATDGVQ